MMAKAIPIAKACRVVSKDSVKRCRCSSHPTDLKNRTESGDPKRGCRVEGKTTNGCNSREHVKKDSSCFGHALAIHLSQPETQIVWKDVRRMLEPLL